MNSAHSIWGWRGGFSIMDVMHYYYIMMNRLSTCITNRIHLKKRRRNLGHLVLFNLYWKAAALESSIICRAVAHAGQTLRAGVTTPHTFCKFCCLFWDIIQHLYLSPSPALVRLLQALAAHSWGLQQLPVWGSPGSASRKLLPSSHPLDSQLLCRSKKLLVALNDGSPSQAASAVAILPTVLRACLILPLGTFPLQVCAKREEAASWWDLWLHLPNKPLHWQCIKGVRQGTKPMDSEERI